MKNYSTFWKKSMKSVFGFFLLLSLSLNSLGQALLTEDFNYGSTAGSLVTLAGGKWVNFSGTAASLNYANTGLSMANYLGGSNLGGSASIVTANTEDAYTAVTIPASGVVYFSTLVNVASVGTTGTYFLSFYGTTTSGGGYKGRLWTKTTGTNLNFGVSDGSTTVWSTGNYVLGTTYLAVVSMNVTTGDVKLYISTSVPATEPTTADASVTGVGAIPNMNSVAIRQATGGPTCIVDGICVFTSWATLSPQPTLTVAPTTLTGFTYVQGSGPSAEQSFTLSGTILNGTDVTITAPADYEISPISGGPFGSLITNTAYNGTPQTVYVRMKAGLAAANYNGETISIAGGGDADGASVTPINGTVTPLPSITSVTVTPPTASASQGGSQQFTANVVAVGGASTAVTWSSSDLNGKVTVDATGLVSVAADAAAADYTIKATSNFDSGKFGTATLTVSLAPAVTSVVVTPPTDTLGFGETIQLTANVTVINGASQAVNWSSSDGANATVDGTGFVSVPSNATPGNYTITATSVFDGTKTGTSTITVAAPSITVTAPNGGEVYDAGSTHTITWTSVSMASENVMIEAYELNGGTGTWGWQTIIASTPNDGSEDFTIPSDAFYGTQYSIRITGLTSSTSDVSDAPFTIIEIASDIAALRAKATGTSVYKLTGEALVSYYKTSTTKESIFLQDASAGIVIYDNNNAVSTVYNVGDGITGIYGTLSLYNQLIEFYPTVDPGVPSSTGNVITPEVVTPLEVTSAVSSYESELLQFQKVHFVQTGNFAASTNYTLTDGTNTIIFRTSFAAADYLTTAIPTGLVDVTAICGNYNGTAQVTARNLADITAANVNNTSFIDDASLTQPAATPVSSLNTTQGSEFPVLTFNIKDAGGDGLPTNVTSFTLTVTSNVPDFINDIASGDFIDETSTVINAGSPVWNGNQMTFNITPGNLVIPEGGFKTLTLYLYLNTAVTDGNNIQMEIDGTGLMPTADVFGSQFASTFASVNGNPMTVSVVATQSVFTVQPTVAEAGVAMNTVSVGAADANGNIDVDFTDNVTMTATGATLGGTTTVAAVNGVADFTNLVFSTSGNGVVLNADASTFAKAVSNAFDVNPNGVVNVNSNNLNIYPNPVSSVLYISNSAQAAKVIITNTFGQQVICTSNTNGQIDVTSLSAGMYFVTVTDQKGNVSIQKFIKK
jgi:uncharacterized protein YjdB